MKATLLNDLELKSLKTKLPKWELSNKKIKREFKFINFIEAFAFMTKVAIIAEGLNHHPDWSNVYSSVKVELTTHDLRGLSNLDIQLATSIEKLYGE
tara:strand:- start:6475 stop:6765 length:291 start_codon:yes stop_codon:yes gene_type:complete